MEFDKRASLLHPLELARIRTRATGLLFDVRGADEYAVSHIAGARRIDTEIEPAEFLRLVSRKPGPAYIAFYCTTMGRSQMVADRLLADIETAGLPSPVVLAGGILAWSRAHQPLLSAGGWTHRLHPHDPETARLVLPPSRVSYGRRP